MYTGRRTRVMAFAAALMTLTATAAVAQDTISVSSPDGRNKVGVATNDGKLYYILSRDGKPLGEFSASRSGLQYRAPNSRSAKKKSWESIAKFYDPDI